MVLPDVGRVAVMSIRSGFAEAILDGRKGVEFRKRPLAGDVTTVLIYATVPVGRVIGAFEVAGQEIASPTALWERHKQHAGIPRAAYREYYHGKRSAVGIIVSDARRLARPLALRELDPGLAAPQSFAYLRLNPSHGTSEADASLREALTLIPR
ncbi:hypothetical protein [Cellulosimicrobium cellulans]|uniref:hypothetical protein n=1 Tax=Cellulosimicrobium cellulans TaxID=1710 RepID=UPI0016525C2D|nr:hypothetical protein [Cellulosimicrobium cellulans]